MGPKGTQEEEERRARELDVTLLHPPRWACHLLGPQAQRPTCTRTVAEVLSMQRGHAARHEGQQRARSVPLSPSGDCWAGPDRTGRARVGPEDNQPGADLPLPHSALPQSDPRHIHQVRQISLISPVGTKSTIELTISASSFASLPGLRRVKVELRSEPPEDPSPDDPQPNTLPGLSPSQGSLQGQASTTSFSPPTSDQPLQGRTDLAASSPATSGSHPSPGDSKNVDSPGRTAEETKKSHRSALFKKGRDKAYPIDEIFEEL